jgi:peptidoglycan/xylan/chitin deacetylase (PgdA/CDA1 family)
MTRSIRARLSDGLKRGLYLGGAFAMSRRIRPADTVMILRYHSVADESDGRLDYIDPGLAVAPEGFDRQMRFLRQHYQPVSITDVADAVAQEQPLPPLAVAVTFDDGYRDNYVHAFPILKAHGIPAAFYITAGCVDAREPLWTSRLRYYFMATRMGALDLDGSSAAMRLGSPPERGAAFAATIARIKSAGKIGGQALFREVEARLGVTDISPLRDSLMTWEQIAEMSRAGMVIGAHTLTHPNLPGLPPAEAEAEIVGSRVLIEERIQAPVRHFAYPNGRGVSHFNDVVRELVMKGGFLSAVTSIDGPVRRGDDVFALQRLGVYRKHGDLFRLAADLERARLDGRPA